MKRPARYRLIVLSAILLLLLLAGYGSSLVQKNRRIPPTPSLSMPVTVGPAPTAGIGILGDSNSDEYQADDDRGGKYHAVTFNWVELLAMDRGLNFGQWGTWGEPRRTGYEYNWARTGATVSSMISSGQHTGLASQIANGEVSLVFIWIGENDFQLENGTYEEIYNGSMSDAELETKIDQMILDINTAVETVLKAGDVQVVIVTISNKSKIPQAIIRFPDSQKRERVSDAVRKVNAGIYELGATHGITVVDIDTFTQAVFARVDNFGFLEVGDQKFNILISGNEPHHVRLDDPSGHAGTVISGLAANALFVDPFNKAYGTGIVPLTDEEILSNAGIH